MTKSKTHKTNQSCIFFIEQPFPPVPPERLHLRRNTLMIRHPFPHALPSVTGVRLHWLLLTGAAGILVSDVMVFNELITALLKTTSGLSIGSGRVLAGDKHEVVRIEVAIRAGYRGFLCRWAVEDLSVYSKRWWRRRGRVAPFLGLRNEASSLHCALELEQLSWDELRTRHGIAGSRP